MESSDAVPRLPRHSSPRSSKRPRVSFATVGVRTFSTGGWEPNKLSSPQERELSPLIDASMSSDERAHLAYAQEDSTFEDFPCIADLCATPDRSKPRRDSMSGDLGPLQREMVRRLGPSPGTAGAANSKSDFAPGVQQASSIGDPASHPGCPSTAAGNVQLPGGMDGVPGTSSPAPDGCGMDRRDSAQGESSGSFMTPLGQRQHGSARAASMADSHLSDRSSEVTANVISMSRLVLQDEFDAGQGAGPAESGIGARGGFGNSNAFTPSRSPEEASEASISTHERLPDSYDLYRKFKMEGLGRSSVDTNHDDSDAEGLHSAGRRAAAGSSSLLAEGMVGTFEAASVCVHEDIRSKSEGLRQGPGPEGSPTVDMAGVVGAIEANSGLKGFESAIPEGRRSFATHMHAADLPTPSLDPFRGSRGDELPGSSQIVKGIEASHGSADRRQVRLFPAESSDPQRKIDFDVGQWGKANGRSRLPYSAFSDSSRLELSSDASAQHTNMSLESAPLPGESCLRPIPFAASAGDIRLSWDEFLQRCGVNFYGPEVPPSQSMQTASGSFDGGSLLPGALPAHRCPRNQRAMETLSLHRSSCLRNVVEELGLKAETVEREYNTAVQRWNQSPQIPSVAGELLRVEGSSDFDTFRGRIESWRASCKDDAWVKWYVAKREWLLKDLSLVQRHSASLQQELGSLREASRNLEELSNTIQLASQQQSRRIDTGRRTNGLWELAKGELNATQEERRLVQKRVPQLTSTVETERQRVMELERQLQEARTACSQEAEAAQEARRSCLRQKARRVALEKQLCSQTCNITEANQTAIHVSLRGGAKLSIEFAYTEPADLVSITIEIPNAPLRSSRGEPLEAELPTFYPDVFAHVSRGLVSLASECAGQKNALLAKPRATGMALEATLPSKQVPKLVQRLDLSAFCATEQLRTIRNLHKACPEVSGLKSQLRDAPSGCGQMLMIGVTVLVVHSHAVRPREGLLPLTANRVEDWTNVNAAKYELEFGAEMESFPDLRWAPHGVQQAFGRRNSDEVARGLRRMAPHASLTELVAATIQLIRSTPA